MCVGVSPFDVIGVSCVVSLQLLVHIKQDNHGGDEVHRLPSGQQVQVGATVAATVAVTGISPGSRTNTRASEDSSRGLGHSDTSLRFSSLGTTAYILPLMKDKKTTSLK